VFERRRQRLLVRRLATHQNFPEALRLRRSGERRNRRLRRHRLLAGDGKEARHEDPAARDRKDRKMDFRCRPHMEEIGGMGNREPAASRQRVDAGEISRINPVGAAPGVLDHR